MEISVYLPETRGAKPKWDFSGFKLGETRTYNKVSPISLSAAAKRYSEKNNLGWEFTRRTFGNGKKVAKEVQLTRMK